MSAFLFLSAVFVGFVSVSGFLFGQIFGGAFSIGATLAGVGGMCCAGFALKMSKSTRWTSSIVYLVCLLALVGVAMDAVNYYMYLDTPGNYYAWPIIGPFAACIIALACVAARRQSPP